MSTRIVVKTALWFTLFLPLGWIAYSFLSGGESANPAKDLNHLFGRIGFYALVLNISIGSMRAFMHPPPRWYSYIFHYRRHLGVAGFFYLAAHVSLHFIMEAGLTEGFTAITEAVYLWIGTSAFLGIFVLTLASNDLSMRKLGRNWKRLHRIVYVLFLLAFAHTMLIEKADLIHFGFLGAVVIAPLVARLLRYALRRRTPKPAA